MARSARATAASATALVAALVVWSALPSATAQAFASASASNMVTWCRVFNNGGDCLGCGLAVHRFERSRLTRICWLLTYCHVVKHTIKPETGIVQNQSMLKCKRLYKLLHTSGAPAPRASKANPLPTSSPFVHMHKEHQNMLYRNQHVGTARQVVAKSKQQGENMQTLHALQI